MEGLLACLLLVLVPCRLAHEVFWAVMSPVASIHWDDTCICCGQHSSWCLVMVLLFWVGSQGPDAQDERLALCTNISFCFTIERVCRLCGPCWCLRPLTSMWFIWLFHYLPQVRTHLRVKFQWQSRLVKKMYGLVSCRVYLYNYSSKMTWGK